MNRIRSFLLLGGSLGLASCAEQASNVTGPAILAKAPDGLSVGQSSGGGGGGYTWTIKKEMVEVHMMDESTGAMPVDPVSPYTIKPNETKWFIFRISYTRTNGGTMGPTAVISDDMTAACATLGAGFRCTSPGWAFGVPGGWGAIGTKTWTVDSSGKIEGPFDVTNDNAGCPKERKLENVATLTSNGVTIKSEKTKTPVESTNCGNKDKDKQACNQGVGNGPEGCDPGNSNHNQPSNDENGGTPGNPGRKKG